MIKEAFPLKYLGGYITAAIFGVITWVLMQFGERFTNLVDMVYPYVIRTLQGMLAQWSSGVDFLLWQLLAVVLVVVILGWVVFRFSDLRLVLALAKSMFGLNGNPLTSFTAHMQLQSHQYLLITCAIVCTPGTATKTPGRSSAYCRVSANRVLVLPLPGWGQTMMQSFS